VPPSTSPYFFGPTTTIIIPLVCSALIVSDAVRFNTSLPEQLYPRLAAHLANGGVAVIGSNLFISRYTRYSSDRSVDTATLTITIVTTISTTTIDHHHHDHSQWKPLHFPTLTVHPSLGVVCLPWVFLAVLCLVLQPSYATEFYLWGDRFWAGAIVLAFILGLAGVLTGLGLLLVRVLDGSRATTETDAPGKSVARYKCLIYRKCCFGNYNPGINAN